MRPAAAVCPSWSCSGCRSTLRLVYLHKLTWSWGHGAHPEEDLRSAECRNYGSESICSWCLRTSRTRAASCKQNLPYIYQTQHHQRWRRHVGAAVGRRCCNCDISGLEEIKRSRQRWDTMMKIQKSLPVVVIPLPLTCGSRRLSLCSSSVHSSVLLRCSSSCSFRIGSLWPDSSSWEKTHPLWSTHIRDENTHSQLRRRTLN